MRKTLLAALAATALVPLAPAHAEPSITGLTCGMVAAHEPTGVLTGADSDSEEFIGVLTGAIVSVDTTGPTYFPSVSVDCLVKVNNIAQDSASATFNVVAVPVKVAVRFDASLADTVTVCTVIRLVGNGYRTETFCKGASWTNLGSVKTFDAAPDPLVLQ